MLFRSRDTLYAAKLVHFPDDDSTELTAPRFISYAHVAPLTITARQAKVTSNGGNVYFTGDVQVVRQALPTDSKTGFQSAGGAMMVSTEYLHLLPDDNIARTDRPVEIRDDQLVVQAGGMELNAENRVLKLSGGVRGTYNTGTPGARAAQ